MFKMLPRPAQVMLVLTACLIACLSTACVRKDERNAKGPLPRLDKLFPDKVTAGQGFNVQANGQSALGAVGANFGPGARLQINGHPMATTITNTNTISGLLSPELMLKDGTYAITVELPDGRFSNALPLVVLPTSGPAPSLTKLYPDSTKAGTGFNVQPNGRSAMGITGQNFLPGVKVLLNGEPQETNFGDIDKGGCFFDAKFYQKPGRVKVTVKNPDGKESAPLEFIVN
jgi:hypothetical protein